MKSEETWKPIRGFPSYEISNLGRVRGGRFRTLIKVHKPERVFLYNPEGKKRTRGISSLMRENWRYEWIKELEEGEEAKPARGFPGYFVTNKARVWSEHFYRWLEPCEAGSPPFYYHKVRVGGKKSCGSFLHTLVGRTFLPEWREGLLILHKEETLSYPEINFPENLWVGTQADNNRDAFAKGRNRPFGG